MPPSGNRGEASGPALSRDFFARPAELVAPDLVGRLLTVDAGGADEVRAWIVETEAYLGMRDPASHAHRGPTPRSAIMFGPPGHLYVYFTYGMHHCANVVTDGTGTAGAVLLRAAMVESGAKVVRGRRRAPAATVIADNALLRGPGNLSRGLGLDLRDNGADLCGVAGRVVISSGRGRRPPIAVGPRIGIRRAVDSPLRFAWAGHPAVSRPRPGGVPRC
ncbi:MAG: DNA-3-methyladenine glycosylase [Candidatus Dormibacteria bacterium]